jgi:hypothetical protein
MMAFPLVSPAGFQKSSAIALTAGTEALAVTVWTTVWVTVCTDATVTVWMAVWVTTTVLAAACAAAVVAALLAVDADALVAAV